MYERKLLRMYLCDNVFQWFDNFSEIIKKSSLTSKYPKEQLIETYIHSCSTVFVD